MPKYLIEREIPGAGQMSASDLQADLATLLRGHQKSWSGVAVD